MIFQNEQWYFLISALSNKLIGLVKSKKEPVKILIIKLDEIGDMIYALPIFEQLKNRYPNSEITLLCKSFVKPLVEHNPALNHIIFEIPSRETFDLIVELRGNTYTLKYAFLHMPHQRLDRGEIRIRNKMLGGQKHEWQTNFEIIQPLLTKGSSAQWPMIYIDPFSQNVVDEFINKNSLINYAVFHCGARRKLRQWPVKNFASIAEFISKKYGLIIVFAGTEEDDEVINEIIDFGGFGSVKCNKDFSLLHFAALVQKAKLFIGNESGPLHIAAAMKTPLVGIYGPGVKDIFYPIGETSRVIHHVLECNPCDQIHCVRPENPCIDLVTVAEVQGVVEEIFGS